MTVFADLMRYLRSRGWRMAFIVHGKKLTPVGMVGMARLKGTNDNRPSMMPVCEALRIDEEAAP